MNIPSESFIFIFIFIFINGFSLFVLFNFIFLSSSFHFGNAKNYNLSEKYGSDNSSAIHAPKFDRKIRYESAEFQDLKRSSGSYPLSNHAMMFYFFCKSFKHEDPVLLWLNGGPGASSTIGLFNENGPFYLADDLSPRDNFYAWNDFSNILFVDQPIGTGLSFANNAGQIRDNRNDVINDLYEFLQQFFNDGKHSHPHQYHKNDFYITGQSYTGHIAPALAFVILHRNVNGFANINLMGVAVGNAFTDMGIQLPLIPKFAFNNNLITQQQRSDIEKNVAPCQTAISKCTRNDHPQFQSKCSSAQSICIKLLDETVAEIAKNGLDINVMNIHETSTSSPKYDYTKLRAFLNDDGVKNELGIPRDRQFIEFNNLVYHALSGDWVAFNTQHLIGFLLDRNIKFLSYVGVLDLVFNCDGVYQAVTHLPWNNRTQFLNRSNISPEVWFGPVLAGSMVKCGPLTYFEVRNAGRNVPGDQPYVAFNILKHWMQGTLV